MAVNLILRIFGLDWRFSLVGPQQAWVAFYTDRRHPLGWELRGYSSGGQLQQRSQLANVFGADSDSFPRQPQVWGWRTPASPRCLG